MDVERALLHKGVHLASICALLRESCDLKGKFNLPGAPMSSPFPYARGARQGSVEALDMWNQVLDYALREPAARCKSEKISFIMAVDYCRLRKRRRRSFLTKTSQPIKILQLTIAESERKGIALFLMKT